MNNVGEILNYAEAHHIKISIEGGQLRIKGQLNPGFLEVAKQNKPDLILMVNIREACVGLQITPVQFTTLCNDEDLALIRDGAYSLDDLRGYAASFAEGISTGRIVFHPVTRVLLRHN